MGGEKFFCMLANKCLTILKGEKTMLKKVGSVLLSLTIAVGAAINLAPAASAANNESKGNAGLSKESISLYKNSYKNLLDRITERGYAATSTAGGVYQGMFTRDSAIQIMAHTEYGDYDAAYKLLNYILSYNQETGNGFMSHIIENFDDEAYGNDYLKESFTYCDTFESQTTKERALFMLNGPNNKALQPFSVSKSTVSGVEVNLLTRANPTKVNVQILTDYNDPSSSVYSEIFDVPGGLNDWIKFDFTNEVKLTPNRKYFLEIQGVAGQPYVAWNGIGSGTGLTAINYDLSTNGGFSGTSNITGFKILYPNMASGMFYKNDGTTPAYRINAPTNKAAQPFSVPFDSVLSVKAHLSKTNDTDEVTVKIVEDYTDESNPIAEQNYVFGDSPNGWQEIVFDNPVNLQIGKTYYLIIQGTAQSGKIVWDGNTGASSFCSINYDSSANAATGGWKVDTKATGFEIVPSVADVAKLSQNETFAQGFKMPVGGFISGLDIKLETKSAQATVTAEIRDSLTGPALTTSQVQINAAGTEKHNFEFTSPVDIDSDKEYFVVLTADSASDVGWTKESTIHTAYAKSGATWNTITDGLSLTVNRKFDEVGKFGGSKTASQKIPVISDEIVTAVGVTLQKNAAINGDVTAVLYKDINNSLVKMDEYTINANDIKENAENIFYFGLPIKKIADRTADYVLEISAPDCAEDSLSWLGVKNTASYTAYKSNVRARSGQKQIDGNYMVIRAWYKFMRAVEGDSKYAQWVEDSYPLVKSLTDYYLDVEPAYNSTWKLIYNPSIEHTRDISYYRGYDVLTNAFASQALYEMGIFADEIGDSTSAQKWTDMSHNIEDGINEKLVVDLGGKKIYAELYGQAHWGQHSNLPERYIKGFSWINFGPVAAEWYGTDDEIMKNTYDKYYELGTYDYKGFDMLDAAVFLNTTEDGWDMNVVTSGNKGRTGYVIGKGWSWDLMYSKANNDLDQVDFLVDFSLAHQTDKNLYIEFWWQFDDGRFMFTDPGNQEHTSWQHLAMSTVYPTLTKKYGTNFDEYNALKKEFDDIDTRYYSEDSLKAVRDKIDADKIALAESGILQAEIDNITKELNTLIEKLEIIVFKGDLEDLVAIAEKEDEDLYTADSYNNFEEKLNAAKDVINSNSATQQDVENAIKALEDAQKGLTYKPTKDALENAIKTANSVDKSLYTKQTVEKFEKAFVDAEKVFANKNATANEISDAANELKKATDNLLKIADSKLEEAFKNMPAKIYVGDKFTISPSDIMADGNDWSFDSGFLKAEKAGAGEASFEALKAGETYISFTDEFGRVQFVKFTIEEKEKDKEEEKDKDKDKEKEKEENKDKEQGKDKDKGKDNGNKAPATGDNSMILIYLSAFVLALVSFVTVFAVRKKLFLKNK